MGCKITKTPSSAPRVLSAPRPVIAADDRVPLTIKQRFLILKSWKGISRALAPTGVTMFVR